MFLKNIKTTIGALICVVSVQVSAQNFKVVLDPGHGGQDFGATRTNYVEKKIVLDVALRVGELLKKDKNIDVVFTRKTDVFIPLKERSNIANKEKADVFVSIHANAVANAPNAQGTETFVMGMSKNQSHLEVAKKENASITLENDYKTSYAGYDPADPTSLIGLTLLQEQYVNQSIDLASKIQSRFTNDLDRKNRGVKQGPFWVLHGAFMPSVLVELGFLSNADEGAYLNSEKGKDELAQAIAVAILDYKRQNHSSITITDTEIRKTNEATKEEKPQQKRIFLEDLEREKSKNTPVVEQAKTSSIDISKPAEVTKKGVLFKVQVAATSKEGSTAASNFKGLQGVTVQKEGSMYKYYYGTSSDINHTRKALEEAKDKGYTSAFLVAFKDGNKISVQDALK